MRKIRLFIKVGKIMNIKRVSTKILFILFCGMNSTPLFSMQVVTGVAMSLIKQRVEADVWLYKYVPFALMVGTIAWTKIRDNQLRKKLDELNEKADELNQKADGLDKKIDQTTQEIKEKVAAVGNDVKTLNQKADSTNAQIGGLNTKLDNASEQLSGLQKQTKDTTEQVTQVGQGVTKLQEFSVQTNTTLRMGINNLTEQFAWLEKSGASVGNQLENLTDLTQKIWEMMKLNKWTTSGIGYTVFFGGRSLVLQLEDVKARKKD